MKASDGLPYADAIDEACDSYVLGRCTIEELEDVIGRLVFWRFPIPVELGMRTVPSLIDERRRREAIIAELDGFATEGYR
jgi:hypothetical protein